MNNKRKSTELVEILHAYCLDLRHREIYLVGYEELVAEEEDPTAEPGVEYRMASLFIRNLRYLSVSSKDPILVHMKSCGGWWEEGMAIYDAIRFCPCHVTILSYTHARSMSSIILQAADRRVLMPNSHFMFHFGTHSDAGTWLEVQSNFEWAKRDVDTMLTIYAKKMKDNGIAKFKRRSIDYLKGLLREEMEKKVDVFLTPEETVDWGLADEVFDGNWDALKESRE